MSEKIVSPGVFTNEIDQSFIPAALGDIGAAIVGPTVKGPVLTPTVVNSYGEYVRTFGELIESGSDNYQYLTSHTAQEYLRQGGPLTIVRVAEPGGTTRATAHVDLTIYPTGSANTIFTLEALGDGPQFNNFVGTGSEMGTDGLLPSRATSAANNHLLSGSYGGRGNNFRWEVANRNLAKGTFTLLIRAGNDTVKKKQILETHANLSLDPASSDYILKRVGNQTTELAAESGVAFSKPVGEYPNQSGYVRVSSLPDSRKTPTYLDELGAINTPYGDGTDFIPPVGSGSYGGAFGIALGIGGGSYPAEANPVSSTQTAGSNGDQNQVHPFAFYENISNTNNQGIDMANAYQQPDGATVAGQGGYGVALSLLSNKDEYNFNLLFLPGVIDQALGSNHNSVIGQAIDLCESRGDCFLVYDNTALTTTVANAKTNTEARNSSYAAVYYPHVQIQDATSGTFRFVPPSVVIAGVYHFNDVVGQPWFAPAGLNRGGIDSAVQAYRKLTQANRDDLYESNANPIATFPGQGVTVFGQKTTQKKASALDRVNVRRLLINVKSFISRSSRLLLFEQNTTDLRDQFLNTVNPFLEQVQSNSGLNAFRVVMDDSNNTPETIDRNQLIGQVFLQPTRTAEFIVLDFIVQPTGAAFPE
tara:strand:- start:3 stop:1937 length:1935 start_codon:yes stop_codon:yes gene_type:complete